MREEKFVQQVAINSKRVGGVISGKWRVNMQESKCSGYSGHLEAKFLGNMARPCLP